MTSQAAITDPFQEARERAALWKSRVDKDLSLASPPTAGLSSSRKEYDRAEGSLSASDLSVPGFASLGPSPLSESSRFQQELQGQVAASGISAMTDITEAEKTAQAQIDAAKRQANAANSGGLIKGITSVASAGLVALCDCRLKEDMAPLQEYEVDDALAALAVAVQELHDNP
jgi:hypothetical protein